MRIAIDGYNLAMARGTGVATYGMETAAALHAMGHEVEGVFGLPVPAERSLRETAFFNALKRPAGPPRKVNRYQRGWSYLRSFRKPRLRDVPLSLHVEKSGFADAFPAFDRLVSGGRLFENAHTVFKTTGRFTQLRLADPPAIMHWTYPVPVAVVGIPNVYTLHDLVPLKLPYATLDDKELYGNIVERCVRTAAQLCTVSESSKRDIVERYDIDPARVSTTFQAAALPAGAKQSDPAEDARAVEGIFGLEHRRYFLYYGAIEPKKNIGRLIEAYLSLQSSTPLVIVGARSWQSESELHLMPGGGSDGSAGTFQGARGQTILRLDYLSRSLLTKLIRGAKAVVFPSMYEGFGLPVLEAMQLGTPVVTSKVSSLPEVAGNAALLIDPYDVDDLEAAMKRVDGDPALCTGMAERGYLQAERFSRPLYQARLAELYDAALARR